MILIKLLLMALLITIVVVFGFWCGFKLVDIATGGEVSRILK